MMLGKTFGPLVNELNYAFQGCRRFHWFWLKLKSMIDNCLILLDDDKTWWSVWSSERVVKGCKWRAFLFKHPKPNRHTTRVVVFAVAGLWSQRRQCQCLWTQRSLGPPQILCWSRKLHPWQSICWDWQATLRPWGRISKTQHMRATASSRPWLLQRQFTATMSSTHRSWQNYFA